MDMINCSQIYFLNCLRIECLLLWDLVVMRCIQTAFHFQEQNTIRVSIFRKICDRNDI